MTFMKQILIISIIGLGNIFNFAFAAPIEITRNYPYVTNHGDPGQPGSIAAHFVAGGENQVYILTTPASGGSYAIYTSLTLPKGSTLTSASGDSFLKAHGNLIDILLNVKESSTVSNVILGGNYKARTIIKGQSADGFTLKDSVVRRTKNQNGFIPTHAHLVNISDSNGLTIKDNFITQAADSGYEVPNNNSKTEASGLYLRGNQNVNITGNTISYVLSAGINTTNSQYVNIINNTIDNTGRAGLYYAHLGSAALKADGITAYHNIGVPVNQNLDYLVQGNTITNWHNHGIHLSGRELSIFDNTIVSPVNQGTLYRSALYIGDFRSPIRCSKVIRIRGNHLEKTGLLSATGIRSGHYKHAAYWVSRNTGDVGSAANVSDHRYGTALDPSCEGDYADE
jgi:hypothetical protein